MSDLSFLYFFLPVFMGLYLIIPKGLKGKLVLVAGAGLIFCADPVGLIPMGVCILSGYLFGIFIHNFRDKAISKLILALEIAVNAAAFLLFHRSAFDGSDFMALIGQQSLVKSASVIGVSVMPLHSIAYCVDIFKKKYVCEHRFTTVAEYIAFFPSFAAGPILSFDKIRNKLEEPKPDFDKCANGVRLLMSGIIMKLFISNSMIELWHDVTDIPVNDLPMLSAWLGSLAFTLFFYFEVCAFNYIACGTASMMGIELSNGFRGAANSYSFRALGRRMNPSLYFWSRNYIYRNIRHEGNCFSEFAAIMISVIATMLWYGTSLRNIIFASAVIIILCLEKILETPLKKLPEFLRSILVLFLMIVIMPFMAFSDFKEAQDFIGVMFGAGNSAIDTVSGYLLGAYSFVLITGIIIMFGLLGYLMRKKVFNNEYLRTIIQPVWVIALLIICTAFLVSGENCNYLF